MIYLFVYTRLENFDYRLIYAPDNQVLSQPIRNEFIDFAREVINTDYYGEILTPRNAIIKRDAKTLVGIGCNNRELGTVQMKKENREVRVFFGIYYDKELADSQIATMVEINFYKNLFTQYIAPKMSLSRRYEDQVNSIVQSVEIPDTIPNAYSEEINVNSEIDVCRIHSCKTNPYALIKACLRFKDIDAVTFLNTDAHASKAPLYKFHNATVVNSESEKDLHYADKEVINNGGIVQLPDDIDDDNSCIYRYIDKSMGILSRAGICPRKFITLFAKKCGLEVIEKGNIDTGKSVCKKVEKAEHIAPTSAIKEINAFHSSKEERRMEMAELQARYKSSGKIQEFNENNKPGATSTETSMQSVIDEIATIEKKTRNPFDLEKIN